MNGGKRKETEPTMSDEKRIWLTSRYAFLSLISFPSFVGPKGLLRTVRME